MKKLTLDLDAVEITVLKNGEEVTFEDYIRNLVIEITRNEKLIVNMEYPLEPLVWKDGELWNPH